MYRNVAFIETLTYYSLHCSIIVDILDHVFAFSILFITKSDLTVYIQEWPLREKCTYSRLIRRRPYFPVFLNHTVFSRIRTEYGEILRDTEYLSVFSPNVAIYGLK